MEKVIDNCAFCSVVIVAYNPGHRLIENIKVLCEIEYVGGILVMDNSDGYNNIVDQCSKVPKTLILNCEGNKGIAYAQNRGVEMSKSLGYEWVLTFDHDSVVYGNILKKYYKYITCNDTLNIGIIGTDYYDIGSKKNMFSNDQLMEVDVVISSGSLHNIKIYDVLGGMNERYFIDQVDNEYCYRLRKNGYKIVVLPGASMEHSLGHTKEKSFWGLTFYLYDQSPIRTYYRTRNIIWFIKEYREWSLFKEKSKVLLRDFIRLYFEENTIRKVLMFIKGVYYGITK